MDPEITKLYWVDNVILAVLLVIILQAYTVAPEVTTQTGCTN